MCIWFFACVVWIRTPNTLHITRFIFLFLLLDTCFIVEAKEQWVLALWHAFITAIEYERCIIIYLLVLPCFYHKTILFFYFIFTAFSLLGIFFFISFAFHFVSSVFLFYLLYFYSELFAFVSCRCYASLIFPFYFVFMFNLHIEFFLPFFTFFFFRFTSFLLAVHRNVLVCSMYFMNLCQTCEWAGAHNKTFHSGFFPTYFHLVFSVSIHYVHKRCIYVQLVCLVSMFISSISWKFL